MASNFVMGERYLIAKESVIFWKQIDSIVHTIFDYGYLKFFLQNRHSYSCVL